jgi:hypothetical protein
MRKTSLKTADIAAKKPVSEPWLRRSLSRARAHLTHAISGPQAAPQPAAAAQGEAAEETQTVETARGRLRGMLQEDRGGPKLAPEAEVSETSAQPIAAEPEARRAPPPLPARAADLAVAEAVRGSARILADPKLAATKAKLANAKSRLAAAKAQLAETTARLAREEPAASEAPEAASNDELATPPAAAVDTPIRTRTMARLLALQGHSERALSIYDELLSAETDPSLHAEAEELRGQHSDAH